MKIKLFTAAIMAMLLLSCQGPMGPQGPQGPPGELNWKVYDFNVPSSAWELVGDADGLNSYYVYVFEGNQAPRELAQVLEYDGDVTGYFVSQLDNGDEVLSPLPYIGQQQQRRMVVERAIHVRFHPQQHCILRIIQRLCHIDNTAELQIQAEPEMVKFAKHRNKTGRLPVIHT